MFDRLAVIESRYEELNRSLMDPQISSDVPRMLEISKEHSDLAPMVEAYRERVTLTKEAEEVEEMLSDPDMKEMAQEEKARIGARIEVLDEQLRVALLPKDPYAGRNLLLEIRAGTGGDEAALFAADLLRMYTKYIEAHGFQTEILSTNTLTVGGSGGKSAVGMLGQGRASLQSTEIRIWGPPGSARPAHRDPGSHPHVCSDGRRSP